MAFLADVVVPRTVDGPARTTTVRAVAVDLALLLLFAVQHSVMARRQVKSWLRRRIPAELERTTYVLATNICLALLLVLWQPWGGQVWHVEGAAAVVLWSLFACRLGAGDRRDVRRRPPRAPGAAAGRVGARSRRCPRPPTCRSVASTPSSGTR